MSKPDSTGESLEAILAAIRKSLAEQSTGVLEEGAEPPAYPENGAGAAELREQRFSAWLPDVAEAEAVLPEPAPAVPAPLDELAEEIPPPPPPSMLMAAAGASVRTAAASAPGIDPVPPIAPAPAPAPKVETGEKAEAPGKPAAAQTAENKDPLWFLSRPIAAEKVAEKTEAVPAPAPAAAPQPAPASMAPPAAAAKPVLKEIVRGPLPPFFGSSAEAAKVEVAPAPPMPGAGAPLIPPVVTQPVQMTRAPAAGSSRPSGQESAPRPPVAAGSGTASEGAPVGKANVPFAQPAADGPPAPAGGPTQIQGLEAMVAELLRPMLRRWLDENMPRLVSAALEAEAELMSKRDPKKP
jgi:cell pole-organizing protein PopZ